MNYGRIIKNDIANGIGVRVSLFVSGCTNRCDECFQPETWDFNYGAQFTKEIEDEIINLMSHSYISGLTILGGDPFEPSNQAGIIGLIKRVKAEMPYKTVWIYTGYTYENLPRTEVTSEIISLADVLVDGRFEKDKKDLGLKFRGSSNQRVIDLNKTRERGAITCVDGM